MNPAGSARAAAAVLFLTLAPAGGDDPAALLAEAEGDVARGRYEDALRLYDELAAEHPDTPVGRTAARRAGGNALLGWAPLATSGPAANRVDVVVAGDGYERKHLSSFEDQAEDVLDVFERVEVLHEYRACFNFVRATVMSRETGVDGYGRTHDTAFRAFDTGKLGHDVDVVRDRVRAALAEVPSFDGLAIVVVRGGQRGTGAGGIAAVAERSPVDLRRAFGGAFAGLGDEITEEQNVFIPLGDHPNLSASEDPAAVPWAHWIEARIPGIGVYPGGLGRVDGVHKPVASDCAMNDADEFCPVCREAIVLAVHRYVDPIDRALPEVGQLAGDRKLAFEVTVVRPASHVPEVAWWVLPEHGAPPAPTPLPGREASGDRRARGPLVPIPVEPRATTKPDRKGVADFELDPRRLEPGRWRVVCRVTDTTEVRGEKHPWVLSDPDGLLASERGWRVVVPSESSR